jgi:hypothetical protein
MQFKICYIQEKYIILILISKGFLKRLKSFQVRSISKCCKKENIT